MAITQKLHTKLNPIQVSLLRLFNRPMSEGETVELQRLLVNYYSDLLKNKVENDVAKKGYTQQDFDDMLNGNS